MANAISALGIHPLAERRTETAQSDASQAAFAGALKRAENAREPRLVAAVRTRLDASQASTALRAAYRNVVGEEPSEETVKILTAQWAHETGNGASMFNYNFGGIKGAGPGGLSVSQRTREGWGDTERSIVDNFRAYRSAEEGATDYVSLLARRFPDALESARGADPEGFVRGLKARGYFTGNEAAYTRSIVALSGVPLPEGAGDAPPVLDAPYRVGGIRGPTPPMSASVDISQVGFGPPIVDALAMADEISRAALRIARASERERETET